MASRSQTPSARCVTSVAGIQSAVAFGYGFGGHSPFLSSSSRVASTYPMSALLKLIAAGMLPDDVRRGYGFEWDARRARHFERALRGLRRVRRATPQWIAWWPEARRASVRRGAG